MKNFNLNELTLETIAQWPQPAKLGLVGGLVVLIVALGYWLIVQGTLEEYDNLKSNEKNLKTEFESKVRQASNLQAYREQLKLMQERFGTMLRQLPTENEMPGLLEDISKTGVASGLTFDAFQPMKEVVHDFYIEVPINITVIGSYHQLAIFLSRVAQMSRIVTLHEFTIEAASKDKQTAGSSEALSMKITAKIYRYRPL